MHIFEEGDVRLAILFLQLTTYLLTFAIGLITLVVAAPVVFLWPRVDKAETYGAAIRRRYGVVLRPWFFMVEIVNALW